MFLSNRSAWIVLLAAVGASGCYSKEEMEAKLRSQASVDLSCPEEQLEVDESAESNSVRDVHGCGSERSYVAVCQSFQCGWVPGDESTAAAIGAAARSSSVGSTEQGPKAVAFPKPLPAPTPHTAYKPPPHSP